jgi:hypothetical protein
MRAVPTPKKKLSEGYMLVQFIFDVLVGLCGSKTVRDRKHLNQGLLAWLTMIQHQSMSEPLSPLPPALSSAGTIDVIL